MSAISGSGGGHYVSDGEIMAWLATTQNGIYDDLEKSMGLSKSRAEMTDALTTIKAELEEANASKDFKQVDADLQQFKTTYGTDPRFSEVYADLAQIVDKVHDDMQAHVDYDALKAQYDIDKAAYDAEVAKASANSRGLQNTSVKFHEPGEPRVPAETHYTDEQMNAWKTLIDGKTDGASKNDQLTMIHIQELKATLDQSSQLGSTFISSGDKTNSAIINNIA